MFWILLNFKAFDLKNLKEFWVLHSVLQSAHLAVEEQLQPEQSQAGE